MKKILIVEDDQLVANIYRNKFSVEGFQVEVALDGLQGLETVRTFQPNALILDLMLPGMSGVDLMKALRADPDFQKLPIIVFSNTYLTNLVQAAWKAGATKCLSKANCTPKQLIEVVLSTLSRNGHSGPVLSVATSAPAAAQVAPPVNPAPTNADERFQADLRKSFVESLPTILAEMRTCLQALVKASGEPARIKQVQELYRRIRALTGNAGVANLVGVAQVSDALEALIKHMFEKPKTINSSTVRTIASAIDFMGQLAKHPNSPARPEASPPGILVVDDEAISRRAIVYALEKAKLKSVETDDPAAAYDLLAERHFELVFLDVDMPGMNGFELCTKLRSLPGHAKTPVVFVTSLSDLESRANSSVSGGNDFIAKPFLFMELAVKALVCVLRGRLTAARP